MRRSYHMSISLEGVLYLGVMGIILTASIIRQINLLMILYGVLAGPMLLSLRLARRTLKHVDVERRAPKTVTAGEPFYVELELKNGKSRGGSFAITAADELKRRGAGGAPSNSAEVYFPHVSARKSSVASYQGIVTRRGIYDFQPIKISTRFPFGLLRTAWRLPKPGRLIVYPRIGKLSSHWLRLLKAGDDRPHGVRRQRGFHDGDFYGLREWRAGDAKSRIHWRTSAKRQALTVRQYERRRQIAAALVLDLWRPVEASPADRERVEEVVQFGATVLAELCREPGREIFLEIVGHTNRRLHGPSSPQLLQEGLRLLATAEAATDDRVAATVGELLADMRPGVNVMLAGTRTTLLDDRERFDSLWRRPELQPWMTRIVCLSPREPAWRELFRAGGNP